LLFPSQNLFDNFCFKIYHKHQKQKDNLTQLVCRGGDLHRKSNYEFVGRGFIPRRIQAVFKIPPYRVTFKKGLISGNQCRKKISKGMIEC